jgi:hypothetical protein
MARVGISQQWLDNLTRHLNGVHADTMERATSSVLDFEAQVRAKARQTPGWSELADEISVWSEDGMLWVGVNNERFASEAWALEYGDRDNAPNSLLRTLTDQVRLTNENAQTAAIARYGTGL